jgi:hypothetical protein
MSQCCVVIIAGNVGASLKKVPGAMQWLPPGGRERMGGAPLTRDCRV